MKKTTNKNKKTRRICTRTYLIKKRGTNEWKVHDDHLNGCTDDASSLLITSHHINN
jgi:hypothetical protein